jgi:hypothetical protein
MKRACNQCEYWDPLDTGETQGPLLVGQCRRRSPAKRKTDWPITGLKDWCGEFEIRSAPLDGSEDC